MIVSAVLELAARTRTNSRVHLTLRNRDRSDGGRAVRNFAIPEYWWQQILSQIAGFVEDLFD